MREIWFRSSTKCCAASRKMDIRSRPLPLRLGSPGRRFITLILDEDGIYDPTHFNDRLLLGLKGTMSEAELHVLKARLQGGILNKARRGELQSPLRSALFTTQRTNPCWTRINRFRRACGASF